MTQAKVVGISQPAQSITAERIAALPAIQRVAWERYLARSQRQMQTDRAALRREMEAAHLKQPLLPPESNSARSIPLDKPAAWYAGSDARHIADIIVSFQTPAGGWSKNLNMADHLRRPGESFAPNNMSLHLGPDDFDQPRDPAWNYVGTFDNDATITEMEFLAKVISASAAEPSAEPSSRKETAAYKASFLAGVGYVFAAQFPNGGWPQVYPIEGGYHDAITFNDNALTNTIALLQGIAAGQQPYAFAPASVRSRAASAVERGIACILAAQITTPAAPGSPARKTVWPQQDDPLTLQPVSGRNFEPAAQSAGESANVLMFLMSLPTPDAAIVKAVNAGAAWLKKNAIYGQAFTRTPDGRRLIPSPGAGPIWARYYAIGSDQPIFGDRDKSIHDNVNELSLERRNGYAWYGAGEQRALDRYAVWSRERGKPAAPAAMRSLPPVSSKAGPLANFPA